MKILWLLPIIISVSACSTAPRTKWNDKNMRVMIDPDSIDEENYVNILQALVKTDKFTVVDRARGWKAAKKEQERLHKSDESTRYDDKEKWAQWAKLYGVGSIIVANSQCQKSSGFLSQTKTKLHCKQSLYMVDANTGEVITAASGENSGPSTYGKDYILPDWEETVASLVDAYPNKFANEGYAKELKQYQQQSKENVEQQRAPANETGGK